MRKERPLPVLEKRNRLVAAGTRHPLFVDCAVFSGFSPSFATRSGNTSPLPAPFSKTRRLCWRNWTATRTRSLRWTMSALLKKAPPRNCSPKADFLRGYTLSSGKASAANPQAEVKDLRRCGQRRLTTLQSVGRRGLF